MYLYCWTWLLQNKLLVSMCQGLWVLFHSLCFWWTHSWLQRDRWADRMRWMVRWGAEGPYNTADASQSPVLCEGKCYIIRTQVHHAHCVSHFHWNPALVPSARTHTLQSPDPFCHSYSSLMRVEQDGKREKVRPKLHLKQSSQPATSDSPSSDENWVMSRQQHSVSSSHWLAVSVLTHKHTHKHITHTVVAYRDCTHYLSGPLLLSRAVNDKIIAN